MYTYLWVLGLTPLQRHEGVAKFSRVGKNLIVLANGVPDTHLGLLVSSALGQGDL